MRVHNNVNVCASAATKNIGKDEMELVGSTLSKLYNGMHSTPLCIKIKIKIKNSSKRVNSQKGKYKIRLTSSPIYYNE